jgi:hypothetical protein
MNSIQVAQELAKIEHYTGTVAIAIQETVDNEGNVTDSKIIYNSTPMSLPATIFALEMRLLALLSPIALLTRLKGALANSVFKGRKLKRYRKKRPR